MIVALNLGNRSSSTTVPKPTTMLLLGTLAGCGKPFQDRKTAKFGVRRQRRRFGFFRFLSLANSKRRSATLAAALQICFSAAC